MDLRHLNLERFSEAEKAKYLALVDTNDIETAYEEFGRELIEQLIENKGIFGKFIEMYSIECDEDGYVTGMVTNNSIWW